MPQHRTVHVPDAPKPVGPYAPATQLGQLVFVSGQGARNPATNEVSGPGIEEQTEQVLRNVEAILRAAGSSLQHVLRCNVYLTDMGDFKAMNRVYERVFAGHTPARTTIEASALPLPELKVEIDCIAYVPEP